MKPRTIIFGDIHGCHEEWQALLEKVKAAPEDRLITVGDLVAKGPSTRKTLDMAMQLPNLLGVKGNNELALLDYWKRGKPKEALRADHRAAIDELEDDLDRYLSFVDAWPLYLDLEECIVVHAGLRPGIPLHAQNPRDLVAIRTLEPQGRPWYEDYQDPKLIVHGHWAARGLVVRPNVIGLDTGCVYGKALTALILPERRIVNVPARQIYMPIES